MKSACLALAILVVTAPWQLRAENGRIEINATCAAVGCFTGDAPGYPVSISQPGSYVLTSALTLPVGASGITILTDDVHVDLNDFTIRGPATCVPGDCVQAASPRLVGVGRPGFGTGQGKRCSVRNGSIVGIDGNGIALTNASQVSHVQVASATLVGIDLSGRNALVERSTIDGTGSAGILIAGGVAGNPAVVRDNVLSNTALTTPGPAISGARSGGSGNVCDDGSCTKHPRYYVTKDYFHGDQALTACAAGFHMASFWEISDPSNLSYDGIRGYTSDDSDSGPPVESFGAFPLPTGFVHNGAFSNNATNDGRANCSDWTSTSGFGTSVALESIAPSAGATGASWTSSLSTCGGLTRVWCVED